LAVHILAQWFKKEYILEVRDLWPEAGIHLGYFKEKSIIYRFFRWCEELLINRAVMVVSVTRGVTENLQKRFPSLNIITVQNGVSQQRIYLEEKTEKQSDAPFKITYFGNMNASSDPLIIADIAKELPENMEIHLVGNGRLKHKLLNQCKKNKLQNVRDHGIVSHSELPTFLRQMDIAIIPILAPDFFRCVISNKLLEAMAAGLVVIFLGEGESAQIVQLSNCGIALPRGVTEIQQITDYLTKLQSNPHELPLVGERGRQFILRNFTREAKTATLVKRVRELL
jgi:glycosyltransferase involved in cell wall biosynthesis